MTSWRVDSLHIALGVVGDSAIHLLVQEKPPNGPDVVQWAMLVDGGDSGGEVQIRNTIGWIERTKRYDLTQISAATSPKLLFNAVVVTHWDKDHWTGLLNSIKNDLARQAADGTTPEDMKVSYFRYGNSPMKDPQTILYCPEEGFLSKTIPRFAQKPTTAVAVDAHFVFGKKAGQTAENICKIRMEPRKKIADANTILGTDLIRDSDIAPNLLKNIKSPSALVQAHPTDSKQRPGIYVVGVSTRVIGTDPAFDDEKVSNKFFHAPNGVGVIDENKPGTPTNKSSIACMIIWPSTPPRLSHYFAGDLHWQEEKTIMAWTGTTGKRDVLGGSVSSMKFSHHGAKSSSPCIMLDTFNPYNLIASVAERNGHPSWELLFYIEGWMAAEGPDKCSYPPVLATQFPYYLVRWRDPSNGNEDWVPLPGGASNQMSMKVLDGSDKSGPATDYKADVKRIFDKAGTAMQLQSGLSLSNPFEDWSSASSTEPDPKSWARSRIAATWSRLSPVSSEVISSVGITRSSDNYKSIRASNMLAFFLIESLNDDMRDGGALFRTVKHAAPLKRLRPNPAAVPPVTPQSGGLVFPSSQALGLQARVAVQTQPVSNVDPKTLKRIRPTTSQFGRVYKKPKLNMSLHAEVGGSETNQPIYSPSGGTNPNENDALLEAVIPSSENPPSDGGGSDKPPIIDPQPDPGLPLPLPVPPFDSAHPLNPPFYFVCSSNVPFSSNPPNTVKRLVVADPLNNFLSTFHLKGLILQQQPKSAEDVLLHEQDEFLGWLSTSLVPTQPPQPPSVQFLVMVDPQNDDYFTGFKLVTQILGQSQSYSTASTITQLGVSQQLLGPAGTIPGQNSIILGLDHPQQFHNLTLGAILQPAKDRKAQLTYLDILNLLLGNEDNTFHIDTAQGARNALWFEPMFAYNTVIRTQYAANPVVIQTLNKWIGFKNFSIDDLTLITKLENSWAPTSATPAVLNKWEILIHAGCTVGVTSSPIAKPLVTFDFNSRSLTITLQFDTQPDLDSILDWIGSQVSGAQFDFKGWFQTAGTQTFNVPILRRLVLVVELDPKGGFPTLLDSLAIDLELGVLFGKSDGPQAEDVVFLFTYEWSKADGSSLQGTLWCPPPDDPDVDPRLLPAYETTLQFEPLTISPSVPWAGSLNLANLIPQQTDSGSAQTSISNVPDGIPTDVTMVVLRVDSKGISFQGAIECTEPKSDTIPKLFLSRISLNANYNFTDKAFALSFDFGATMFPWAGSTIIPIELNGAVSYNSGTWSVWAGIETPGMQGAHFLNFFDEDTKLDATALIQHIRLIYLTLDYEYDKADGSNNAAMSFAFHGSMGIGQLELDIDFLYTAEGKWTFKAQVDTFSQQASTVQEILDSIMGDGSVDLPSCVANIAVGGVPAGSQGLFQLECKCWERRGVYFVNVGSASFTFLQYRNTSWNVAKNPSKRFLRLEVHNLPDFEIPIIGTLNLSETIQEVYFMWVQDGSEANVSGQPPGFTKSEISNLNTKVLDGDLIYFKLTKNEDDYQPTDVIVEAGCHFVIVTKDSKGSPNVAMDYVFARPEPNTIVSSPVEALKRHAQIKRIHGPDAPVRSEKSQKTVDSLLMTTGAQPMEDDADAGGGIKKTSFKVAIGLLSISNIGLKFNKSILSLFLDASIAMGPIAMGLQGFSIDFDFGNGHDLQRNFPTPGNGIGFSLQGLMVDFDRPPLVVGGGLVKQPTDNTGETYWAGGVDIAFKAWSFLAAGAYGNLTDPATGAPFTTTFVFAQLKGPLINLSYASIQGLTGGFGYNNALTLPTIAEVITFPFLNVPTPPKLTGNPNMDMLMALIGSKWFKPTNGSFWVAAGLTVTAFQMLQVTAVAMIEWDPEVKAGIYAVAIADIPSIAAPFKIAHVELGISATVDFGKGVAAFEGQLAPSSFILDPACHLTGGFALYYWFEASSGQQSGNSGDWVFTLGGYHASYKPPQQYPNPPRLQIQWSLGPLSITGQAYFAITPVLCMVGGSLYASLSIGVLNAWLNAFADFVVNYQPFSFKAVGGISVGVRYRLDLLFTTVNINIEISATLTLLGPPFQGSVFVDFWVFSFTIKFGSQEPPIIQKATLEDFYHLALQKGSPTAQATPPVPHKLTCVSGLLPLTVASPSTAASTKVALAIEAITTPSISRAARTKDSSDSADPVEIWEVSAGIFTFSISSVFAISNVVVNPPDGGDPVQYQAPQPETTNIYSRSMYLDASQTPLKSELVITMKPNTSNPKQDILPNGPNNPWKVRPIVEQVPRALWDVYDQGTDPNNGSTALLNNPNSPTVPLMMSVLLIPPAPRLSVDLIKPFDAVASQLQDVFPTPPGPPDFPDSVTQASANWLPDPSVAPPPSDPAQPWEIVQAWWETPSLGAGTASALANAWSACMGWNVASNGAGTSATGGINKKTGIASSSGVSGSIPQRLISNLQNMYVAPPMVAVQVA